MDKQPQIDALLIDQTTALLSSARSLLKDSWQRLRAQNACEAAEQLAQTAQENQLEDLSEALLGFAAYLSSFADSTIPNGVHLEQLKVLIESIVEAHQRHQARIQLTELAPEPTTHAITSAVVFFGANANAAELVAQRVARLGYRVDVHKTPDAVVSTLIEGHALALVLDAAVLDIWAATIAKRDIGARVPIIVVSEVNSLELRLTAMHCKADVFFMLPDDAERIASRLAGLIADRTEPYRVLIVDDDKSMRLFCDSVLRHNNMITRAVAAPEEALEAIAEFTPDVILADLYMPGLTGFELLALFRAHPRTAFTPVIFLSGDADTEKRFAALHIGGDDYLTKPIRPRHLVAAIINRARRASWMRRELLAAQ